MLTCFKTIGLFASEDRVTMFLRNVGNYSATRHNILEDLRLYEKKQLVELFILYHVLACMIKYHTTSRILFLIALFDKDSGFM